MADAPSRRTRRPRRRGPKATAACVETVGARPPPVAESETTILATVARSHAPRVGDVPMDVCTAKSERFDLPPPPTTSLPPPPTADLAQAPATDSPSPPPSGLATQAKRSGRVRAPRVQSGFVPASTVAPAPAIARTELHAELDALASALSVHLSDDSLIKGWEADRRIFKTGKQRGPLRAAARDIRAKAIAASARAPSPDENRGNGGNDGVPAVAPSSPARGRARSGGGGRGLDAAEGSYLIALRRLFGELRKANEQDFDAHLRDGMEWCARVAARLRDGGGAAAAAVGATPSVLARVYDRCEGAALLRRLHAQRGSGHRGRAVDRDLAAATTHAEAARRAWAEMQRLLGAGGGGGDDAALDGKPEADIVTAQEAYLRSLGLLCAELEREGEPDFDGLLRNGINFLQNKGKRVCF